MKVNTFTKFAIGLGVIALSVVGLVVPAQADPSGPSNTALVGVGSDTTQDVMDEIAAAIGGNKLASYKATIDTTTTPPQTERIQTRVDGSAQVLRAKGSSDGFKILNVAEGSVSSLATVSTFTGASREANKANSVGQIDFERASSKQGTQSNTGEYVNVPFAIDSVGIAVNPGDAVAKIPLEGLGTIGDAATKATVDSIFRCQARYVYINTIAVGAGTVTSATFTKAAHGLAVGDRVAFSSSGSLPSGLSTATNYFVIGDGLTTGAFKVSATKSGSAITTGGSAAAVTITKTMGAQNTYNSVGATSGDAPVGTSAFVISPLIPGYGSGTASYFVGKIGRTEGAAFPSMGDAGQNCISRTFLDGFTSIQEHSGQSLAERENSIGIYSIGQWTSQTNSAITGATDRTSGTTLLTFFPKAGGTTTVSITTGATLGQFTSTAHGLAVGDEIRFSSTATLPTGLTAGTTYFVKFADATTFTISATSGGTQLNPTSVGSGTLGTFKVMRPTTGTGETLAPNENWTADLKRVVYNVMPYRKAADPTNPLNAMFVGTGSLVCQQTAAIAKMGFTVLSSTDANNVNSCGSIANGNRSSYSAGLPSGATVKGASIADFSSSSAEVGVAKRTTVKIGTSTHQMGGTVQVLDAAIGTAGAKVLGSVAVAEGVSGTTDTNIDVTVTKVGSTTLYAYFVPALAGIEVTSLKWGGDTSVPSTTTLTASAGTPTVAISVRKPSAIGGTGRVVATINGPVAPGGTVELFQAGDFPVQTGVTSTAITTFALKTPAVANAFNKSDSTVHGLTAGTPVKFSGATCPAAITVGTTYFVSATGLTTTAFRVAATATGAAIATSAGVVNCTVTTAAPTVFTKAAHRLDVGNRVTLTGTLPTGFTADTAYFVASVPTADTFTLAATSGGAGIVGTANGSGTYTVTNTTPLAAGTLSEGETSELMNYTQSQATMTLYVRYVSADGSLNASNSSNVVVTVPKLAATLAVTLPAAPNGFAGGTAPAFANAVQFVQVGTTTTTATVSLANDTFAIAAHGLTAGTPVRFTATTLPTGISAGTTYYVISEGLTAGVFKVSARPYLSAVNLGTQVTAGTLTVNSTADTFTATAHGLTAGSIVQFGGTPVPTGITAGANYYVIAGGLTSDVFKVSTTLGGTAVNVTANGTDVTAFTGVGAAVKVFKSNVAPKVTLTATAPSGATAKPSGTITAYIGASAVDRSHRIEITGATLAAAASGAAGTATATLTEAATWSWLGTVATTGKTVYLIIDYSGDGVYGSASLSKAVKVTTGY
jgi:hypothetical protein